MEYMINLRLTNINFYYILITGKVNSLCGKRAFRQRPRSRPILHLIKILTENRRYKYVYKSDY